MSEMGAEKKKEIDRYIVTSYFGRYKNVEAYVGGADIINGSEEDDIPDLLVEVEDFSKSDFLIIRWNVLSESGSEWENEFMLRFARKREIERNRCDSVDAMWYPWEAWRSKIQGKPVFLKMNDEDLQKDKRIEELEKEINALRAEKEVMERHIQELESQNVSLAETNAVLNNKLNKLDPMPEFKELLKKLYSTNDIENLEWTLNHVCGGRGSVNGWIALSSFWKQKYETISKLVGFVTVEEIQDYLTNEANCDTLHEAISNLHDEVKYTSNEWKDMDKKLKECEKDYISAVTKAEALDKENEELKKKLQEVDVTLALSFFWKDKCKTLSNTITTWKYATGCKAPEYAKELIADKQRHIVALRDQLNLSKTKNEGLREEIEVYSRALKEWKEGTGCPSPSAAKTLIDSMYTPLRESYRAMRKEIDQAIDEWQKATGRISPEEAKQYIDRLKTRLNKIHDCAVDW